MSYLATTSSKKPASIENCHVVDLPKIPDARGNLTFIEEEDHISFSIQRAYWIYDVPGGQQRGGHAYKRLQEFMIALSGSFDIVLDDGHSTKRVTLNRPYYGLYVPNMIWRHLDNFSTNSVCLILASLPYTPSDYIYDRDEFLCLQQCR